jgi:hypothetical protein
MDAATSGASTIPARHSAAEVNSSVRQVQQCSSTSSSDASLVRSASMGRICCEDHSHSSHRHRHCTCRIRIRIAATVRRSVLHQPSNHSSSLSRPLDGRPTSRPSPATCILFVFSVASRLSFAAFAFPCALATLNVFSAARFSLFPILARWFSLLRAAAFFSLRKLAGVLVMNLVRSQL